MNEERDSCAPHHGEKRWRAAVYVGVDSEAIRASTRAHGRSAALLPEGVAEAGLVVS